MVYSNSWCSSALFLFGFLFSPVANCWEIACAVLLYVILTVCIPFPFGVCSRMWNSTVSVPEYIAFSSSLKTPATY